VGEEVQGRQVVVAAAEDRVGGTAIEKLSVATQPASGDAAVVQREKIEPTLPLSEW
jgi:hypothetical protein